MQILITVIIDISKIKKHFLYKLNVSTNRLNLYSSCFFKSYVLIISL